MHCACAGRRHRFSGVSAKVSGGSVVESEVQGKCRSVVERNGARFIAVPPDSLIYMLLCSNIVAGFVVLPGGSDFPAQMADELFSSSEDLLGEDGQSVQLAKVVKPPRVEPRLPPTEE